MVDHEPRHDDLFEPSLASGSAETAPPYNLYYALVPGIIGGPPAVTIAMVLIARRLRASRVVIAAIIAVGVAAFVAAGIVVAQGADASSGSTFRAAAVISYAAQFPFLIGRFRSWQLRGKDTAPFVGLGLGLALGGLLVIAVVAAVIEAG